MKDILSPLIFMCEKSIHNALFAVFGKQVISGCFLILRQSLWRKIQGLHLTNLYLNDDNFSFHAKMLLSASFLPIDNFVAAFEILVNRCP